MQRTQPHSQEAPERMSWARAMVYAVGFFFLAAILIGQLPSYINLEMTSSITAMEQGALALAAVCLAGFIIIQVVVLLFDPKPLVPPIIFVGLGFALAVAGLAIIAWCVLTVHQVGPNQFTNNQYFPQPDQTWNPLLGGHVLWFQPAALDLVMVGCTIFGIGAAMAFYGTLAQREVRNPDRSDPGTTFGVRLLLTVGIVILAAFTVFYTLVSDTGLASVIYPQCPTTINPAKGCPGPITGLFIVDTVFNILLSIAVLCTLGAFALRLHYLMRPIRNRTMSILYFVGINLAPVGVIFFLAWLLIFPAIAWIYSWSFIGLGNYLIVCGKLSSVPGSCIFSQQAGYIVDTVITTGTFGLFMIGIWAWRGRRNAVIITGVTLTAVLALATLLTHLHPDEELIALLLCGGALTLGVIWTSVARREFTVVGERNLGCLGQWFIVGTCLLIYVAAFGFFSIPGFRETETNIPFTPGKILPAPPPAGQPPTPGTSDAVVTFIVLGILAAIQFYFLIRNRYKI